MAIKFDQKGLLIPAGPCICEPEELTEHFVSNEHRRHLHQCYLNYMTGLRELVQAPFVQWIDGSFVEKNNHHPNDIDTVSFIDAHIVNSLGDRLNLFRYPESEKHFGVDGYIVRVYKESEPKWEIYKADRAEWYELFSRTRPNRSGHAFSKGFLEIMS